MAYIIVDIDGTVADLTHRLHHIKDAAGVPIPNPNWDAFFDDCHGDVPIEKVWALVQTLHQAGHDIIFLSGRSERVRRQTTAWLQLYFPYHSWLYMRTEGDHRPDEKVKPELLDKAQDNIVFNDSEILCVLDDRKRVVEMWRNRGLLCLQVVEGDY